MDEKFPKHARLPVSCSLQMAAHGWGRSRSVAREMKRGGRAVCLLGVVPHVYTSSSLAVLDKDVVAAAVHGSGFEWDKQQCQGDLHRRQCDCCCTYNSQFSKSGHPRNQNHLSALESCPP